jgi:uncharacterized DUF497 family protein
MEFAWDPDEATRNLAKHGVSFAGAATVLGDPLAVTFADPDHPSDEGRFPTFGLSAKCHLLIVSHPTAGIARASSAPGGRLARRGRCMSKVDVEGNDDLRPEYDASVLAGGVRGKHLERYRAGTNLALLAPDVRAAFPADEAFNRALRSLLAARGA